MPDTPDCGPHCPPAGSTAGHCSCSSCHGKPVRGRAHAPAWRLRLEAMVRSARARRAPALPRRWFQDEDGTYFRNCPLIAAERGQVMSWPLSARGRSGALSALAAEWREALNGDVIRKEELGPGDVVVAPASFRGACPRRPGLWALDDPSLSRSR